ERTRNYPAAEHPRELADWHGAAADLGAGDLGDRLGVAGRDAPLAAGPAIGRAGRALDRLYHRAPVAALRAAAVVSAAAVPALLAYIEAARLCHVATPSSRLVAAETKVGTRVAPPLDVDRMCPALSDRRDAGLRDDLEQVVLDIDLDMVPAGEAPFEQALRDRVLDQVLDDTSQRSRAVLRVVAALAEQVHRLDREVDGDLLLLELLADARQLQIHDLANLLLVERVEDHDVVDTVQELRSEDLPQLAQDTLAHRVVLVPLALLFVAGDAEPEALALHDLLRADVRGHDDDRVAEVHSPPLGIGQAAVLKDLQEHVECLGVRLLDLVEQDHRVALAADRLGQLATLLVSDVARR